MAADVELDELPDWPAWALSAAEHEALRSPDLPPECELERQADRAEDAYARTHLGWD